MFKQIAIANDGSEGAFKALSFAIELAHIHHAHLHMLSVEEMPDFPSSIDEVVEEKDEADHRFKPMVERAQALAKLKRVKLEVHILAGHPVRTIVDFVKENAVDHLVIGFMGHSALYERIIGGTADRLVRFSPCSVTVVK
ncbi:MAG: universal stress protein [Magnetospirillum sp.]|nr:MAG: universal stress protein [Magnetospirillum sp.]